MESRAILGIKVEKTIVKHDLYANQCPKGGNGLTMYFWAIGVVQVEKCDLRMSSLSK